MTCVACYATLCAIAFICNKMQNEGVRRSSKKAFKPRRVYMSLRHAILASLAKQEATGYEITKQFDSQLGFFWQASHQQIYRELAKLTQQELVEFSSVTQAKRPDKKLYELTDRGEDELVRWLSEPIKISKTNDGLSVKMMAGHVKGVDFVLEQVKLHQNAHAKKLKRLQRFQELNFANPARLSRAKKLMYLTVRKQILIEEAWLKWVGEVNDLIGKA